MMTNPATKGFLLRRMEHVGIVVHDLEAAIAFFSELGLVMQGRAMVEGRWVDGIVGLEGVRSEIAMMETPDGNARLELTKYHAPAVVAAGQECEAPAANAPGIRHLAFAVEDIEGVIARLQARCGTTLVGELGGYGDRYRLCYLRGPEGIIIELAEEVG
jgi:catechol 2,3-dioxygenase-like lactoylglutathione lyase family enzyme